MRLGVDGFVGIVDLVESMHRTIASRAGILGAAPSGRTSGVTGFVYGTVRGGGRALGRAIDATLSLAAPVAESKPVLV